MSDDYSERISQISRLTLFKALGSLLRIDDPEDPMKPRRVIPRFVRSLAFCITVASIYMTIVLFGLACSQFGVKDTVLNVETTDRATCLYFSVVTWTTLGYGDVVPTPALRPIAALEAMVG